jgi:hypothetical protein
VAHTVLLTPISYSVQTLEHDGTDLRDKLTIAAYPITPAMQLTTNRFKRRSE